MTVPSSTFQVDEISNSTASEYNGRYNLCQRSGQRAKPGELVQDPYTKAWVLPRYLDKYPEQLFARSYPESREGAFRPEQSDNFIASSISPEDL